MCECNIVLNDCYSDCDSDCEMHESECVPTWRHVLCEAFFTAPDCQFANKEFCEARCLSYPQALQNTSGEASVARLHRRLVDRVGQAVPPPVGKKSPTPKSAQTSAPPAPPRVSGAQGGSLDGGGWIDAPGAGWGAHYCQLTALTGPRGVLCVHLGVPV